MATIKEIAEKAGVSIGTVDRVLHDRGRVSEETRQRVLQLVQEMGYQPNTAVRALAIRRKGLKLAFFTVDPAEHPFFAGVLAGVRKKAEELAQYNVEVDIHICHASEMFNISPDLQADGIALFHTPGLQPVQEWAVSQDIPVVYYNIPCEDGLAYVGCDYEQSGRIAAGLCALMTRGRGRVGILSEGDERILSCRDRVRGFRKELGANYPDMHLDESAVFYTSDTETSLDTLAVQMLSAHPDLDVIYLINPGDYRVCRTIREHTKNPDLRIITNDLTDTQRRYMQEGLITATICQEPERQGALPLEILFQYLANGLLPEKRNYPTDLSIHILQNM